MRNKGFTIPELLVIVAIVAMVIAIAIPQARLYDQERRYNDGIYDRIHG